MLRSSIFFVLAFLITTYAYPASPPRKVTSEYIATEGGGFMLDGKSSDIKYALNFKLIKDLQNPHIAIVEFENPEWGNKPLIIEKTLMPGEGDFIIESPSLKRIINNKNYVVLIKLFSETDRKRPISTHRQEIQFKIPPEYLNKIGIKWDLVIQVPEEFVEHKFDERKWVVAHQMGDREKFISERIIEGNSIGNWEELLTIIVAFKQTDAKLVNDTFLSTLKKECPSIQIRNVVEKEDDIVYELFHNGCNGFSGQHEVRRIMKGSDGIYIISYAAKLAKFHDVRYNQWRENIKNARLKTPQTNN